MKKLIFLAVLLLAAGCGTPGVPQPPSLHLPKPVEDLRAVRKGDTVRLTWTVPIHTTDEQAIGSRMGATRVCRNFNGNECRDVATEIPAGKLSAGTKFGAEDTVTAAERSSQGKDFVSYAVEALNDRGKSAGPSNVATVFLAPAVPAVEHLSADLKPDALLLHWTLPSIPPNPRLNTKNLIRVVRTEQTPAGQPAPKSPQALTTVVAELPAQAGAAGFADRKFAWEKEYSYRVVGTTQVVTGDGRVLSEFEGDEPSPVMIRAHDIFPPSAPVGVQAVYSSTVPGYIDLTWTPNDQEDIAGYNIYRAATDGKFIRMNPGLVKTPAFRDVQVAPGHFTYRVTAVDERGNESPQSEPATENVPQQ